MKIFELGKATLSIEDVSRISKGGVRVRLAHAAIKRIEKSNRYLLKKAASGETIYGVNTGFGLLSNVRIEEKDLARLQVNLLRSHAVGTGDALDPMRVRAMVLLRAATLTQGNSGVSLQVVNALLDLLNHDIIPYIPEQGSVGASGDLSPLAHLALVLIGEGKALVDGSWMNGAQALKLRKLQPVALGPKEGLALINGTQFMAALAVCAVIESEQLMRVALYAGGMTLEALRGTSTAFDEKIHLVRPHPGQIEVARQFREVLSHPGKSQIAKSHEGCGKVQDPYSLRCIPQVHGASLDTLRFVREIVEREINSVTDNPLVFVSEDQILSGGNFHGQYLALAMDFLAIAMAEIGSISEQRIEKLINPAISELPAFLMKKSGINSGFMIVQVAAASIVSENKTLCHPASVDTIPTSADKEDHVSMGAWAARKCLKVIQNVRRVLAMEVLAGAQGLDLLGPLKTTPKLEKIKARVRSRVPFFEEDAPFYEAIAEVESLTREW
ncbi:MAG: histidine ammonia-lyase [Bdellovibrionales bacterium]|nr:histidine ammonia-lyase [Bdellovibrionales bacterium]